MSLAPNLASSPASTALTFLDKELAEQVLMESLKKLDKGKKSRTGMELQRGLLIAFTAVRARHILWQNTPTPAIHQQILSSPSTPQMQQSSSTTDYSCQSASSMLAAINNTADDDLWGVGEDDEDDEEDEIDSDSDDMDISQEDPFDPVFPTLVFLDEQPTQNPSDGFTNLTTVVPGSEAHITFHQHHPSAHPHLSNPLTTLTTNVPLISPQKRSLSCADLHLPSDDLGGPPAKRLSAAYL